MTDTVHARFSLGDHLVEVTEDASGTLSLAVDGCLRKRRGSGVDYLWTNVELPFEDHHLVEVRRRTGEAPVVTVNGDVIGPATRTPATESGRS